MQAHPIVSRDEWVKAQRAHLKTEKALTRMRDMVAAERRALPWVKVESNYVFDTNAGPKPLAELFGPNSQLIVHHLMYHPDWEAACPGCTFQADHIDGPRIHLEHHDVSIVAVSRAPLAKLNAYKKRMGWNFEWVSSNGTDFNRDFHVTFTPEDIAKGHIDYNFGTIVDDPRYFSEELPGISVFCKGPDGEVFLTQSIQARGLDLLIGAHHYFDITPKGRSEIGSPDSIKRRDEYDDAAQQDACCGRMAEA